MSKDAIMEPSISKELDRAICTPINNCQIYPATIVKNNGKKHHNCILMEGMSEVGIDTRTTEIHILVDFKWERQRYSSRTYKGRAYYIGRYRVDSNQHVGISKLALKEYSFAPFAGVCGYLFGWAESPFLMRDATSLMGEPLRKLLQKVDAMKKFAENCL